MSTTTQSRSAHGQAGQLFCVPCLTLIEQGTAKNSPDAQSHVPHICPSESSCPPLQHLAPRACSFLPGEGTSLGRIISRHRSHSQEASNAMYSLCRHESA